MRLVKIKTLTRHIADLVVTIAGCVLYAVGFSVFIEPNAIAAGGATGIATLVHHFFAVIPVGFCIIVLNIPLFILGFLKFKGAFLFKTVFATVFSSALIDMFSALLPKYRGDTLLAALAAGVASGTGIALIMLKGATTGGTDIVAKLINLKYRFIPIGRLMLMVDAAIVAVSGVLLKSLEVSLYSVLYLFTISVITDRLLYGAVRGKLVFIITERQETILDEIALSIGRGVTRLNAIGGYTGENKTMLLCAVRTHELSKVLTVIKTNDENAFVIVSEAGEILGEGFNTEKS